MLNVEFWENMLAGACGSLVFGLIGLFLLFLGYKVFDWITPKLDVEEQLQNGNTAVGVVVAAILLSVAYLATHVVHWFMKKIKVVYDNQKEDYIRYPVNDERRL